MLSPARIIMTASTALFVSTLIVANGTVLADEMPNYQKLNKEASPALVTIKCVVKFQGMGGNRERERELTGIMIDSKGLVLCSSFQLGTSKLMKSFGTVTPTDIKILIGNDTEGVDAKLLTSDPDLDLSWIQIKEPSDKGYVFLNFSKSKELSLGTKLLAVKRLGKFFDRTTVISEGRLSGVTKKPRKLLVPSNGLDVEPGMPVFGADCATVGLVVVQSPDPEDMDANPRAAFEGMASLILPSGDVEKATKRAKATVESEDEESEEDEEE